MLRVGGLRGVGSGFPEGIENSWEGEGREPLKKREWPVGVQGQWGQMRPGGKDDSVRLRDLGKEGEDTYCQSGWSY